MPDQPRWFLWQNYWICGKRERSRCHLPWFKQGFKNYLLQYACTQVKVSQTEWVGNYTSKKKLDVQAQKVMINGSYLTWVPVVNAAQGSTMGPGLFNIVMIDLEEVMGCPLAMFVDSTDLRGPRLRAELPSRGTQTGWRPTGTPWNSAGVTEVNSPLTLTPALGRKSPASIQAGACLPGKQLCGKAPGSRWVVSRAWAA